MADNPLPSKGLFSFLTKPKTGASSAPLDNNSNLPNHAQAPFPLQGNEASRQIPENPQNNTIKKPLDTAIRTMRSDIEQLFRTTPPSIAQMISNSGPATPAIKRQRKIAERYLALGIFILILAVIGSGIFYFRAVLFLPPEILTIKKAVPSAPFFATETSRTIAISPTDRQQFLHLMSDVMKEFERDGTIKRILIRFTNTIEERFATMSEFLEFYHISPPQGFLSRISRSFMAFTYSNPEGTRFGMATRTNDPQRTLRDLLDWEPKMITDLMPLFFGRSVIPITAGFEDRSFRNIDWRYLKLSPTIDIGIGYTIFPAGDIILITTSKELMEIAINRLFDAR